MRLLPPPKMGVAFGTAEILCTSVADADRVAEAQLAAPELAMPAAARANLEMETPCPHALVGSFRLEMGRCTESHFFKVKRWLSHEKGTPSDAETAVRLEPAACRPFRIQKA